MSAASCWRVFRAPPTRRPLGARSLLAISSGAQNKRRHELLSISRHLESSSVVLASALASARTGAAANSTASAFTSWRRFWRPSLPGRSVSLFRSPFPEPDASAALVGPPITPM
jgi:hypothetical protein